MNMQLRTLSNGTRVVLVAHADTAAVTVLTLFAVGSRYESAKLSGVSHFIEHMLFKGTSRRPSSIAITRDLDSVGAEYNAFTGKEYTGYYVKLQSARLGLAVDMLEDMIFHSKFAAKEIDAERKVIGEEIHMYEDNPMMLVDEVMEEELFNGAPLGRKITGTKETLAGISRAELVGYHETYYVPSRTVIAVAGNFDEREVMNLLEHRFGERDKRKAGPTYKRVPTVGTGKGPRVRVVHRETNQVQLSLGFPAFGFGDDRVRALGVLSVILGGNMSSRLFMNVREKHGMAYSIRSSSTPYMDTGAFDIEAGLTPAKLTAAIDVILKELRKMKTTPVTSAELSRAKEYLKGRTMLGLEESSALAEWYGRQLVLTGKTESPEARIEKIFAVTKEDIMRVANEVFDPKRAALAIIGPFKDAAPFTAQLNKL